MEARYTQNRKVPGSNPTDGLGQALEPNLITKFPVNFGSYPTLGQPNGW